MKPRITIITVAVDDLRRSLRFYREAMGWTPWWPPPGHSEPFDHAAFNLAGGLSLVLNPRSEFAREARVGGIGQGVPEFTLTHALPSREEVDALLTRAQSAGATLIRPPADHPWGYAAEIRDPDGHLWEVLFNPDLKLED